MDVDVCVWEDDGGYVVPLPDTPEPVFVVPDLSEEDRAHYTMLSEPVRFDTPLETGCIALTAADADEDFLGVDSHGALVHFHLSMIVNLYAGEVVS